MGAGGGAFPAGNVVGKNYAVWATSLTKAVRADFPNEELCQFLNQSRQNYAHEGGLEKHELFIADWLTSASDAGFKSATLSGLVTAILGFAESI